MARTKQVEVWVAIDEEGDYAVGTSRDDAVSGVAADAEHRTVRVVLTVPVPEPAVLTADLSAGEPVALVAAAVA